MLLPLLTLSLVLVLLVASGLPLTQVLAQR